jgi:hypothetical protein
MEQIVTEIYRTQEAPDDYYFVSAVFITYFGDTAFVQGLSGTFTTKCWREVCSYLKSKGCQQVHYYRRGVLKVVCL